MPDRTIEWGDPNDAGTKYRTQDDDPAGGGNFVVAEDTDGNTVLLQWNPTASQWEYGGPVDLGGNDLTSVGTATVNALKADTATIKEDLTFRQSDVTVSAGSIDQPSPHIRVFGEGGTSDTLNNITNDTDNQILYLRVGSESITLTHQAGGDGQLDLIGDADKTMTGGTSDMVVLFYDTNFLDNQWIEIGGNV